MLCARLTKTFDDLNMTDNIKKEVYSSIISYSLNCTKSSGLKKIAKHHNIVKNVMELKKSFLDTNYYMLTKFWRGVWWYTITGDMSEASTKYNVSMSDLELAEKYMSYQCLEKLINIDKSECEKTMSDKERLRLLNILMPYINNIARRKLTFISKYDSALGMQDFAADLITEAIRIINHYDYLNELMLLNYARRSVHNKVMNIIGYRNTQSRNRLIKVENENENEDNDSENKSKSISITMYQNTVYSMDKMLETNDTDENYSYMDYLSDDSPSQLDEAISTDIIESISANLTPNEVTFINIVSGKYDEEFEKYVVSNNMNVNIFNDNKRHSKFSYLVKNAAAYTGVSKSVLKRKLCKSSYFKNQMHKNKILKNTSLVVND